MQCTNTTVILKSEKKLRHSIGIFIHEVSFQKFNGHSSKQKQFNKQDKAPLENHIYVLLASVYMPHAINLKECSKQLE